MMPNFHFVFFTTQEIFHYYVKCDFLYVDFKSSHWVVSHFTYQTLANRSHMSAEESSSGHTHSVKLIFLITANHLSEKQCLPYCQILQKRFWYRHHLLCYFSVLKMLLHFAWSWVILWASRYIFDWETGLVKGDC